MILTELAPALEAALERLGLRPLEPLRPFVIVEEPLTKRFVQFCTRFEGRLEAEGRVVLDLPLGEHSIGAHLAKGILGGPRYVRDGLEHYQVRNLTPAEGVRLALRVLRDVHALPDIAEVYVQEGTQPRNAVD